MTATKIFVALIRAHAISHYNEDGWDYIVEAWEDSDITEAIEGCITSNQAIKAVHMIVKMLDDRRKDIQSERF